MVTLICTFEFTKCNRNREKFCKENVTYFFGKTIFVIRKKVSYILSECKVSSKERIKVRTLLKYEETILHFIKLILNKNHLKFRLYLLKIIGWIEIYTLTKFKTFGIDCLASEKRRENKRDNGKRSLSDCWINVSRVKLKKKQEKQKKRKYFFKLHFRTCIQNLWIVKFQFSFFLFLVNVK